MEKQKLVAIAAVGHGREIGTKGTMPWRLPSDLKRFRQLTKGHSVIMGRLTFESILEAIRKPLPKRQNIIVTRSDFAYPGTTTVHSVEEAINAAEMPGPIFVAGGGQIYRLFHRLTDEMWLTHVHGSFPEADTFFPEWLDNDWIVREAEHGMTEGDSHFSTFRIWQRAT